MRAGTVLTVTTEEPDALMGRGNMAGSEMKQTDKVRTGWFVAAIGGLFLALDAVSHSETSLVVGGVLLGAGLVSALR